MNILIVDNHHDDLNQTMKCLQSIFPDAYLIPCDDSMDAVRYGYNHKVDVVYTEVVMTHITGFDVVRLLRKTNPNILVYYLSNTKQHLQLSIKNKGNGYYLKPIQKQTLLYENQMNHVQRQLNTHH